MISLVHLFLLKPPLFSIIGSKKACDVVCFSHHAMTEFAFIKASRIFIDGRAFVMEFLREYVFSFSLRGSVDNKLPVFYYKWQ